jgi:hypothetical protein
MYCLGMMETADENNDGEDDEEGDHMVTTPSHCRKQLLAGWRWGVDSHAAVS